MSKTIYYSNQCQHSRELVTLINKNNAKKQFQYVCVDNNSNIPPNVQSVPTLLVQDNQQNKLMVGEEIFKYIESLFNNNQSIDNNSNQSTGGGDPEAWHINEMGSSYSDMYSFIDDTSSAINHSFSFLDGNNNTPEVSNNNNNNNNFANQNMSGQMSSNNNDYKDKLSQDVDKLMQTRDSEIPRGIQRV